MFRRKLLIIVVIIISLTVMTSCGKKKTTEPAEQCATPVLSPVGGTYSHAQDVIITCPTSGASIRYTTNGSDPTSSSTVYTNLIAITATKTVKAKAFKSSLTDSNIASAKYTIETTPDLFVNVPGGAFTMGNTLESGESDELPTHSVTLSSFYMGKYEVTQSEWQATMGSIPYQNCGEGDNYPVYNVSWYAIIKYCNLRSMAEDLTPVYTISGSTNPSDWGAVPTSSNATWDAATCNWSANGYRLPTEAEWEYAARGGTTTPDYLYSGSDDINAVAWHACNNIPNGSKPVGGKAANGFGIYDMSGNVYESCWDWYSSTYYNTSPSINPLGPDNGSYRLLRGGGWGDSEYFCRVSYRGGWVSEHSSDDYHIFIGFRLCRAN